MNVGNLCMVKGLGSYLKICTRPLGSLQKTKTLVTEFTEKQFTMIFKSSGERKQQIKRLL